MNGFKMKYWIVPLALLVVITLLFRSGVFSAGKAQPPVGDGLLNVAAAEPQYISKVPKLALNGSLEGQISATVSAKISGRIEQVLVQDGQQVKAGDPLVRLESVELANATRMAQDVVTKAQANYDNAQADYSRYLTLYEKSAVSRQQLDSIETKLKIAAADLSSALASLGNAEQQYGYGVLTAPVDGVVANKTATIGQVVSPGMALMNVENISQVYAVVHIEQKDLGLVNIGQKTTGTVDAYPDKKFEGIVDVINPEAGSSNRMFRTKVKIDNGNGLLKPGMYIKIELETGEAAQILTVPQSAIIQKQGLYYVFILENNKAVRRQVNVGDVMENTIEIKSGLPSGQRIAISNVNKLKDGDTVLVTE